MPPQTINEAVADELVSACRTVVGDELRSITYFNRDTTEQLYLRADLDRTADLMGFAEIERMGFRSDTAYRNSQLGEYQATVRMFENGFLTRVIQGDHGLWITTDSMSIDRFDELVHAVKSIFDTADRGQEGGSDR